jgi:hypothetical protein
MFTWKNYFKGKNHGSMIIDILIDERRINVAE